MKFIHKSEKFRRDNNSFAAGVWIWMQEKYRYCWTALKWAA